MNGRSSRELNLRIYKCLKSGRERREGGERGKERREGKDKIKQGGKEG